MRYPISEGDHRPVTAPAGEADEVTKNWRRIWKTIDTEDYVILKGGEPVAVIVDWNSYQEMLKR